MASLTRIGRVMALLWRFSSPAQRFDGEGKAFCPGSAHREVKRLGLDLAVGRESDFALGDCLVAIAHGERGFLAGVAVLREADGRCEARIHRGDRCNAYVFDLHIVRGSGLPKPIV